jgi:phosphonate transport system substrate-binding protein
MVDNEMVLLDDFKVLWRSPAIPADPIVYRAGLCEELKKQIADAFLSLHSQHQARGFLKKHKAGRMMTVSDADYRILREVRAAKERLKLKDKGKIN